MTRAEQLAAIFDEFNSSACECECEAGDCIADRAMADEILRLRKQAETITSMLWEQVPLLNRLEDENVRLLAILAMLRKPDLDVLASAMTAWSRTGDVPAMIHAAIRAAEQGVGA